MKKSIYLLIIFAFASCVPELPGRHFEGWLGLTLLNDTPSASSICDLHYSEVTKPENAEAFQKYLQEQAAKGSSGTPIADTTSITGLAGSDK